MRAFKKTVGICNPASPQSCPSRASIFEAQFGGVADENTCLRVYRTSSISGQFRFPLPSLVRMTRRISPPSRNTPNPKPYSKVHGWLCMQ